MPTPTDQADLVELLRARGQRVTSQRVVVLRALRRLGRHATADEVLGAVQHELPGIAAPTIYATLDLFVELGLAQKLHAGRGGALYDPRVERHQHAVCRRCGRVQDVVGDAELAPLLAAARAGGFHPEGAEVVVSGLCADCAQAAD
jgi:Fe2+ or Zn2+ uptake regulation protein